MTETGIFNIEDVVRAVLDLRELTGKDLATIWKHYTHDLVKKGHTLSEVMAYNEDFIERGLKEV